MSDSMVVITYTYQTYVADRVPTCGGMDSELTGTKSLHQYERTIICAKNMVDTIFDFDLKSHGELVGEKIVKNVSLTYPAPYYWG